MVRVTASRRIEAPPAIVYAILADYDRHRRILPPEFRELVVERGGVGAGTVFRYRLRILGRERRARAEVTEPEPGRVLAETDTETGLVTTFTVDPVAGENAQTTIETIWQANGLSGFVQQLLAPRLLRRLYREELENLAKVAASTSTL